MTAIYHAYVEDRAAEGKRAVPRMRDAWKRLAPHFGPLAPLDITEATCRNYMSQRYADGVGPGTVHVELGYLRAAVRFARAKRRWITDEPFIPLPKKPEPKDHYLTKAEAERLIASASAHHVRLFIILALSTAGRAEAILDLTWNRIDFERRKIYLRDPDKPVTIKGRAITPMNETALAALSEAKEASVSSFVIEWGAERVGSVKKAVARAAAKAGVICTPHVLRHTAAVWMVEAGIPLEQIAQYLGHNDINTTRRIYARFSPDYLQAAAAALELNTVAIGQRPTSNRERHGNRQQQVARKGGAAS